jgi:hypothetical protein
MLLWASFFKKDFNDSFLQKFGFPKFHVIF